MQCIACKSNDFEIFSEDSWLKIPVSRCKKCHLLITGSSLEELEKVLKEYFLTNTTNEELDRIIESNFDTRHGHYVINQSKSMIEYCNEFFHQNKKLLEIGTGPGVSLTMFEKKGFDVIGIDANEKCVKFINEKLKNGKCIQGFVDEIEIDEKFDVIWLSHCLEHMPKPHELLKKCRELLKKDGIIFVAVPNCENENVLKDSIYENASSFHYSENTLERIGNNVGLKKVKSGTLRELYRFEGRFHLILEKNIKQINRKLCPYYPFKVTSKTKGHEIRMIFKKMSD